LPRPVDRVTGEVEVVAEERRIGVDDLPDRRIASLENPVPAGWPPGKSRVSGVQLDRSMRSALAPPAAKTSNAAAVMRLKPRVIAVPFLVIVSIGAQDVRFGPFVEQPCKSRLCLVVDSPLLKVT